MTKATMCRNCGVVEILGDVKEADARLYQRAGCRNRAVREALIPRSREFARASDPAPADHRGDVVGEGVIRPDASSRHASAGASRSTRPISWSRSPRSPSLAAPYSPDALEPALDAGERAEMAFAVRSPVEQQRREVVHRFRARIASSDTRRSAAGASGGVMPASGKANGRPLSYMLPACGSRPARSGGRSSSLRYSSLPRGRRLTTAAWR